LVQGAGRWSLLNQKNTTTEQIAQGLLKRYGVVFVALLQRESLPPWRDLVKLYRRLEARGEIRGGRFVAGFGGEQFAAADAVGRLRAVRKLEKGEELVALSGADPLNLVGILTPDARVPALAANRVLLRDGIAIAAVEGGKLRRLAESELSDDSLHALARRFHWRALDPYLRSATLLRPGAIVVDLGAAPGGWSQVAAARVRPGGRVIAIDLLKIAPITGVEIVAGDFRAAMLEGVKADIVLSDLAPNLSGVANVDQARAAGLAFAAIDFCRKTLKPDGVFVVKTFHGEAFGEVLARLQREFRKVMV